jgi:hypothetical protein
MEGGWNCDALIKGVYGAESDAARAIVMKTDTPMRPNSVDFDCANRSRYFGT